MHSSWTRMKLNISNWAHAWLLIGVQFDLTFFESLKIVTFCFHYGNGLEMEAFISSDWLVKSINCAVLRTFSTQILCNNIFQIWWHAAADMHHLIPIVPQSLHSIILCFMKLCMSGPALRLHKWYGPVISVKLGCFVYFSRSSISKCGTLLLGKEVKLKKTLVLLIWSLMFPDQMKRGSLKILVGCCLAVS